MMNNSVSTNLRAICRKYKPRETAFHVTTRGLSNSSKTKGSTPQQAVVRVLIAKGSTPQQAVVRVLIASAQYFVC